jgi:ABC-type sugar transport system permease subunit
VIRNHQVGLGSAYAIIVLIVVIALATVFTRYMESMSRRQRLAGV